MRKLISSLMVILATSGCEKAPAPNEPTTNQATNQATAAQTTQAADPHQALKETLVMVVQTSMFGTRDTAPLQDYLSKAIGKPVLVQLVPTDDQVIDQLKKGEAQITFTPSWTFMVAHQRADMEVQAVTTVAQTAAVDSLWVVSAKSKIKKTTDLKGKRVAFTSATSAEGFLFPLSQLMKDGVLTRDDDPEQIFASVAFAGDDAAALKGVEEGKYDAAAISSDALPKDPKSVRIIAKQGPVPRAAFSVKSTLDPGLQEKIAGALLGLGAEENSDLRRSLLGDVGLVKQEHYQYTQAIQDAIDTVDADYPL
ncbi:MAG: phosphate/phosphite/phosphonate ABC transporter substrate-binding protein [bacterium]